MSTDQQTDKSLLGRVIDGKYRLDEELGSGGMGTVYLATQVTVDRPVALKLLHSYLTQDPSVRKRFEVEAKAIARLKHPNCVTLYEFGYSQELEALFTVVEYIKGKSLEHYVGRPIAWPTAIDIMRQVALAVQHAHQQNIIHRDLKPDNIMVEIDEDGRQNVKILDFGIARIAEVNPTNTRLTKIGQVFGTPPYMSPEQGRNNLEAGPTTDLYSMGIILYELLTGSLPFQGDSALEILMKHVMDAVPPIENPEIPEALKELVYRLLEKEPANRPQDCATFIKALDAIPIPAGMSRALADEFEAENATWMGTPAMLDGAPPGVRAGSRNGASLDEDSEEASATERLPAGKVPNFAANPGATNPGEDDEAWLALSPTTVRSPNDTPRPASAAKIATIAASPPAPVRSPSAGPTPTPSISDAKTSPNQAVGAPGSSKGPSTQLAIDTARSLSVNPLVVVGIIAVVIILLLGVVFFSSGSSDDEAAMAVEPPTTQDGAGEVQAGTDPAAVVAIPESDEPDEPNIEPNIEPNVEPNVETEPAPDLAVVEAKPDDSTDAVVPDPVVDKPAPTSEKRPSGKTQTASTTGTQRRGTSTTTKTEPAAEEVPRLRLDDVRQPPKLRLDDTKKTAPQEENRPEPERLRLR